MSLPYECATQRNDESESDDFESADEDFISDHEKDQEHLPKSVQENLNSSEKIEQKSVDISKQIENCNIDDNACKLENNTSSNDSNDNVETQKQKRRERPQRTREPKPKLGTKLGTKITENKSENFWEAYSEAKKNEYADPPQKVSCWEENTENEMYSEKFTPNKNFWDNEEDYMELPQDKTSDSIPKEDSSNSWASWGTWGVSSLLSTAQLGVTTITSSVSQGISTVLETGIGVPDPEELARLDKQEKTKEFLTEPEEESENASQRGFGLGNLVKLVETTGTKVITGGLDTLEVIGKKTLEVLQEGDPGLKKKRAMFNLQDKPVLSQILREAKEKAELENKLQHKVARKPHYETIFDDYQGLVHLEALEMLSKQCDIKLETLMERLSGIELTDIQETLAQIKELCELPDEEDENSFEFETVQDKFQNAVSDLNISISYDSFLETWREIDQWLEKNEVVCEDDVHQKAIDSLARLTAIAVEQFHKSGELLLIKERRSTVDEADSLVQLTITLTGILGSVAGKFSEKLNSIGNSDNVNSLITNIFLEAANSSSYIQDAFNLMIPVLQVGAV